MKAPFTFLLLLSLFFTACSPEPEEKPKVEKLSLAEELANKQLEAYNNRDLLTFLEYFHDSVLVYDALQQPGYKGKTKMFEVYEGWFGMCDTIHCEILNRISAGNTVIDHERIYYTIEGRPTTFEAIAIYKVWGRRIKEVHFVRPEWE
ncbi:MAG: steroid delta-isomerase [Bacteroidetes bacterium]|nr:steroid delta-isomerase [Bacteroidota bacterium]